MVRILLVDSHHKSGVSAGIEFIPVTEIIPFGNIVAVEIIPKTRFQIQRRKNLVFVHRINSGIVPVVVGYQPSCFGFGIGVVVLISRVDSGFQTPVGAFDQVIDIEIMRNEFQIESRFFTELVRTADIILFTMVVLKAVGRRQFSKTLKAVISRNFGNMMFNFLFGIVDAVAEIPYKNRLLRRKCFCKIFCRTDVRASENTDTVVGEI